MCFVLYAATAKPLPRKKWAPNTGLSVEDLSERDAAMKIHFSKPEVQYIGSTSGCGCDFPHATLQNGAWPEIEYAELVKESPERMASGQLNKQGLADLLRTADGGVVELYGVWDGDFASAPAAREAISIETILDPAFRFKDRGFYEVLVP